MSQFYLKNGSRRSAQSFPIDLPDGIKFSEAKESFAEMLAVSTDQASTGPYPIVTNRICFHG